MSELYELFDDSNQCSYISNKPAVVNEVVANLNADCYMIKPFLKRKKHKFNELYFGSTLVMQTTKSDRTKVNADV